MNGILNNEIEAVFIDRDGTMGSSAEIEFPYTFVAFKYVNDAVQLLKKNGIKVFVFTNQSCIARGKDNRYDFDSEFSGYGFDDWFICPHDNMDNCECRKPKSGLLLQAAKKHKIDLSKCLVIGDRLTDIEAGLTVGCKGILVKTGRGEAAIKENSTKKLPILLIADDLNEVTRWICNSETNI